MPKETITTYNPDLPRLERLLARAENYTARLDYIEQSMLKKCGLEPNAPTLEELVNNALN